MHIYDSISSIMSFGITNYKQNKNPSDYLYESKILEDKTPKINGPPANIFNSMKPSLISLSGDTKYLLEIL